MPRTERDPLTLLAEAREQPIWYHTIELTPEYTTPGHVDLRPVAARVLPARLDGLRALDIGTYDGFWAFELETRGASEVLAADLETWDIGSWPPKTRVELRESFSDIAPGDRFRIAHALRDSSVRHLDSSIYALDRESLGGAVDFAVIGALLLHLRDPVGGLEATRAVLRPGGRLLVVEPFDLLATMLRPRTPYARLRAHTTRWDWWLGNLACLHHYLTIAGFEAVHRRHFFRIQAVKEMRTLYVALEARVAQ